MFISHNQKLFFFYMFHLQCFLGVGPHSQGRRQLGGGGGGWGVSQSA